MIKLTRIDDRLLHGQVAFAWTAALGINCLLVANDQAAQDDFLKMTLKLAKPAGAKLFILSIQETVAFLQDEKNKNLKILLIINSVKDASILAREIPEIQSVNFGGIRGKEGSRLISKAIAVTDADIAIIQEMLVQGIELEIRQVPTDSKQMVKNLI